MLLKIGKFLTNNWGINKFTLIQNLEGKII